MPQARVRKSTAVSGKSAASKDRRGTRAVARTNEIAKAANKERSRLAAIVDSSDDAILAETFEGIVTCWNDAAERMFVFTAEEMIGKPVWALIPESRRGEESQILERLKGGERVESFETVRVRKDGGEVEVSVTFSPIKSRSGRSIGVSMIARDITRIKGLARAKDAAEAAHKESLRVAKEKLEHEVAERKRAAAQLRHAAYHDALTGLPNRAFFADRLKSAIGRAKRHPESRVALLYLDLDRFRIVNESLGHAAGDQFLAALAPRLASCLRPYDTLARMSGDEFTILLEDIAGACGAAAGGEQSVSFDVTGARDACVVAERVLQALVEPFRIDGRDVAVTASIGIAVSEPGYEDAEAMLRDADSAMYRVKQSGGGRYELFARELHFQTMARLQLETDLRRALERKELRLAYQPIVALETGKRTGFEALVRWPHAERGMLLPGAFIPLAEETGLILPLGEWVLAEACRQARSWQDLQPEGPPLSVSVNVSARQLATQAFDSSRFSEQVTRALAESGLDPARLNLDVAENALWYSAETESSIAQLHSLGIAMHLDDFGTGHSSLSGLQHLPIDTVKIDRSFISGGSGPGIANQQIVRAIVVLAQNLGKRVTAEGVETAEQLSELQALHCTNAQGYYLSRPLDEAGVRALLTA